MGWTEINYSCGHSGRVRMYGPMVERERKVEWMSNKICSECYKAKKREEVKSELFTAKLINNVYSNGYYLAIITGDTYSIKETLKSIGCRWMEYYDNEDILGVKKPKKAWMIKINPEDIEEVKTIIDNLRKIGISEFKTDDSILSCINAELAERFRNV